MSALAYAAGRKFRRLGRQTGDALYKAMHGTKKRPSRRARQWLSAMLPSIRRIIDTTCPMLRQNCRCADRERGVRCRDRHDAMGGLDWFGIVAVIGVA